MKKKKKNKNKNFAFFTQTKMGYQDDSKIDGPKSQRVN